MIGVMGWAFRNGVWVLVGGAAFVALFFVLALSVGSGTRKKGQGRA